ncbi:MAG: C1 family peptidase [Planctomycetes bacterium]|nr:C1 family peptidase [Planctomycetota bacterium]
MNGKLALMAMACLVAWGASAGQLPWGRALPVPQPAPMGNTIVVEGEALAGLSGTTNGQVSAQQMATFGTAWSGGAQLYWVPTQVGARLSTRIQAPATGNYSVAAAFTRAPDYGTVQLSIGQAKVGAPFNGYDGRVSHSGKLLLGVAALQAGPNALILDVVGKDPRATGLMVGLDVLELTPAAVVAPAAGATVVTPAVVAALRQAPPPTAPVVATFEPPLALARPVMVQAFSAVKPHPAEFKVIKSGAFELPNEDLRPSIQKLALQLRDQGGRGTCSVHAMTFLLEYMYATRKNLNFHDLSEEYLNYAANLVSGKMVDGDFFSNLDLGYQKWGAYPEALVPYKAIFDPKYKVPQAYMDVGKKWVRFGADFIKPWNANTGATMGQLYEVFIYLEKNTPVAIGMWWPKPGFFKTTTIKGVDVMAAPQKRNVDCVDGHSVAIVGYRKDPAFPGGGYFIFRNSWGANWGDQGYGYLPFDYALKYANDLVAYRE